jgi:hypothetical protein
MTVHLEYFYKKTIYYSIFSSNQQPIRSNFDNYILYFHLCQCFGAATDGGTPYLQKILVFISSNQQPITFRLFTTF